MAEMEGVVMRTKAEAAANPQAGDRWRKDGGTCELFMHSGNNAGFKWDGPISSMPPLTRWDEPWLPSFQKWCRDADYLGGSDDNQG